MSYSRRRFLTDLLFVGGAVAVAAGMAATAEPQKTGGSAASASPTATPSASPTGLARPGQVVATPNLAPSYPTPGRMPAPRKTPKS